MSALGRMDFLTSGGLELGATHLFGSRYLVLIAVASCNMAGITVLLSAGWQSLQVGPKRGPAPLPLPQTPPYGYSNRLPGSPRAVNLPAADNGADPANDQSFIGVDGNLFVTLDIIVGADDFHLVSPRFEQ